MRKGLFYCLDWKQMYESLFRIFFRTSFRQILPLTASKILAIRKYACGFFLVTDKIMRKNPHIKRYKTSSENERKDAL